MEENLETAVCNAASEGKLEQLMDYFKDKQPEEVECLVSSVASGVTPLIAAGRNGHLDVVTYLIETCHVDVEQMTPIIVDGETVNGAHPLWCAAAFGNYDLVRILIEHNASVNCTTEFSSTPVRAACFNGDFEIMKYLVEHGADIEIANRHGNTCLMSACRKGHLRIVKYLLECGADVNKQDLKGSAALHECARSGNLVFVQLLLLSGAALAKDAHGVTPLITAALWGHDNVIEYFINSDVCLREEKVAALELLGSTYIDMKDDMAKALDCWRRAMHIRYENPESPIYKPPSELGSYMNIAEVSTFEQLDQLAFDPGIIRIHSLIIKERILGPAHPLTAHFMQCSGARYAKSGNYDRCLQLWIYTLHLYPKCVKPLSSTTQNIAMLFAEELLVLIESVPTHARATFQGILHIFHETIEEIKSGTLLITRLCLAETHDQDIHAKFHQILKEAIHLLGLLCKLQQHVSEEERCQLKEEVYRLIQINPRGHRRQTLLHIACDKGAISFVEFSVSVLSSCEVVKLLLELGACPDAVDEDLNTPLHITAINNPVYGDVFKTLLSHGAHLDVRNEAGLTPLKLINASRFDLHLFHYVNLQCLCANVIQTVNIPFHGKVSTILESFLERH